jgi:hypothetical protein
MGQLDTEDDDGWFEAWFTGADFDDDEYLPERSRCAECGRPLDGQVCPSCGKIWPRLTIQ